MVRWRVLAEGLSRSQLEVIESGNEVTAQSIAAPPIAIAVSQDLKNLEPPIDMFNADALASQLSVVGLLQG